MPDSDEEMRLTHDRERPWWERQREALLREFSDITISVPASKLFAAHEAVHRAVDLAGMQATLMSLHLVATELADTADHLTHDEVRANQYREIAVRIEHALDAAR